MQQIRAELHSDLFMKHLATLMVYEMKEYISNVSIEMFHDMQYLDQVEKHRNFVN